MAPQEIRSSVPDLIKRIGNAGERVPVICTFEIVFRAARAHLERAGHRVLKMPGPFARREIVASDMERLAALIRRTTSSLPEDADRRLREVAPLTLACIG